MTGFRPFPDILDDYLRGAVFKADGKPEGGPFDDVTLTARKQPVTLAVSSELLMDMGVIEDTRPPVERKPLPWRTRFRWWRTDLREKAGQRAYRLISGSDFPDQEGR